MFNTRENPTNPFDVIQYLRSKNIYHQQLSKKYEEREQSILKDKKYFLSFCYHDRLPFETQLPVITFKPCHNIEHIWMKHIITYRCINCGIERIITGSVYLPLDILTKILRMSGDLFNISRTICKTIRNASLSDILQHEMTYPLKQKEISILSIPYCIIETISYEYSGSMETCIENHYYVRPHINGYHKGYYYKYQLHKENVYAVESIKSKFGHGTKAIHKFNGCDIVLYVDFINYHKIILQRLSLYDCDRYFIAKSLLIKFFHEISNNLELFALFLCATACTLDIKIDDHVIGLNIIPILSPMILDKINELCV